MKKFIIIAFAALCLGACAYTKPSSNNNADTERYLNAWITVHKQAQWKETPSGLGVWIMEEEEGKGAPLSEFTDSMYLSIVFTQSKLDGTISATTSEAVSKQLGKYDETYYYGPIIYYAKGTYSGIEDAVKGMKKGGRRKVLIPSWLMTYSRFDTRDEYLAQKPEDLGSTAIYDISLVDYFEYLNRWSVDTVSRYLVKAYPEKYGSNTYKAAADSAGKYGFYYYQREAPSSTEELKDTTVYINYTGRLLNGLVFDTTIRDTAIFYGLPRNKTYSPVAINIKESWDEITMGSDENSLIAGFKLTLSKMGLHEKGTGIFISSLGYGYKGSGSTIPAYAPLRFDIELVDKP